MRQPWNPSIAHTPATTFRASTPKTAAEGPPLSDADGARPVRPPWSANPVIAHVRHVRQIAGAGLPGCGLVRLSVYNLPPGGPDDHDVAVTVGGRHGGQPHRYGRRTPCQLHSELPVPIRRCFLDPRSRGGAVPRHTDLAKHRDTTPGVGTGRPP